MTQIFKQETISTDTFVRLARALEQGAVAVLPTDTVYGMATGAFCEKSIERIYQLKKRPSRQPLQLLIGQVSQVHRVALFSSEAQAAADCFWPGSLTLILPPTPAGRPLLRGCPGLGIRVPAMPFLQNLLAEMTAPLACTSANEHGCPVVTNEHDLLELFNGKVDFIVLGGTLSPTASSVVDVTGPARLLREGVLSREKLEQVMGISFIS